MIKGDVAHKTFNFPAGEMHVRLTDSMLGELVNIEWNFERNDEIIELLLYVNALFNSGYKVGALIIPYFPFSRQDRVAVPGDSFSLQVMCSMINSIGAQRVVVYDSHSDVLPSLLNNMYDVKQEDIFYPYINDIALSYTDENIILISPDAGALKKTYMVAKACACSPSVISCSKKRDPKTGDITGTVINCEPGYLNGKTCIIIDDICDGGRTFTEIAKVILGNHIPVKIILMVTHGLFTKGLQVFDGLIDEIYTRRGKHVVSNLLSDIERRAV